MCLNRIVPLGLERTRHGVRSGMSLPFLVAIAALTLRSTGTMAAPTATITAPPAAGISPPTPFNFDRTSEWPEWIMSFDDYRHASGLNERTEEAQVRTLLYTMGRQARKIFQTFGLTEEESRGYEMVKKKFDTHFVATKNIVYESANFHRRKQEPGESADNFVTALHELADRCEFAEFRERMIRDRFVVGLEDAQLSEALQMDSTLTLATALAKARLKETVHRQQLELRAVSNKATTGELGTVQRTSSKYSSTWEDGTTGQQRQSLQRSSQGQQRRHGCQFCGRPSHARAQCPARSARCDHCGIKGHFARVCHKRTENQVGVSALEGDVENFFVGTLNGSNARYAEVSINGVRVSAKIDSGAEVTVVPPDFPGIPSCIYKSQAVLRSAANRRLEVNGCFSADIVWKGKTTRQTLYVVESLQCVLLGLPAIEALGVVKFLDVVEDKQYEYMYPQLFSGLGTMSGEYTIRMKQGAIPFAIFAPRRIPIPLKNSIKVELAKMVKSHVIRKVDGPTKWCAGMVPVVKPSGEVRICVDLTQLNKSVLRERFVLPTVDDALGQLAGATYFSKLDANSGFHQVKLAKESQELTTFITPFGRYCFQRMPFGITSAPEYFQKRMAEILDGLQGVVNLMDDVLVYGATKHEHDERLHEVLKRLVAAGVTLNRAKCSFCVTTVAFLGYVVDASGIRPDPKKVRAINEMPTPSSVDDVRRFLGMINYLARFMSNLADVSAPLRSLLVKDREWHWGPPQKKSFECLKQLVTSAQCIAKFDPKLRTIVSADASSFGLGCVLMQVQSDGERRPVAYHSRSLTPTEQRYAQIEKEALALTWAAERLEGFLIGLEFQFETDHKPLVSLLGQSPIDVLPPRIQRFRLRLMRFRFSVSYVPGKQIGTADALSRAPCAETGVEEGELDCSEVSSHAEGCVSELKFSAHWNKIRLAQEQDDTCRQLQLYCRKGWPRRDKVSSWLSPYWSERANLTICDGVLLHGSRLVVPQNVRSEVLCSLHEGHQGIVKCRARARESVWWPGLSTELGALVNSCRECARLRVQKVEPMMPSESPSLPWLKVGADLFHLQGKTYVAVVDYFSRYPELALLSSTSSAAVIVQIKSIFARHGIPELVVTDNGPQFASAEFALFAASYGFRHVTSSPRYPQSNGEAERTVQTVKRMLEKSADPYLALLAYRDSPGPLGTSPAQLLMGRRLRSTLPVHPKKLVPSKASSLRSLRYKDKLFRNKQRLNYDRRHAVTLLPQLVPGNRVWIKDSEIPATVLSPALRPRSYRVRTDDGTEVERNRRALVRYSERTGAHDPSYDFPANLNAAGQSEEHKSSAEHSALISTPAASLDSGRPGRYMTRYGREIRPPQRYGYT